MLYAQHCTIAPITFSFMKHTQTLRSTLGAVTFYALRHLPNFNEIDLRSLQKLVTFNIQMYLNKIETWQIWKSLVH